MSTKQNNERPGSSLLPEKESTFLALMMQHYMKGTKVVCYQKLKTELRIGDRVKSQIAAWKVLIEEGYIVQVGEKKSQADTEFQLSQKGIDYAATDEYKDYIKSLNIVAATNEEHQANIKNKLLSDKNKSRTTVIFDLLDKHGSLTSTELAALCNCKRGTHKFSYGLAELKSKGYVEISTVAAHKGRGKKLCLSDKAYLTPEDRKAPDEMIDQDVLEELVLKNNQRKRSVGVKMKEGKDHTAKKIKVDDEEDMEDETNITMEELYEKAKEEGDNGMGFE